MVQQTLAIFPESTYIKTLYFGHIALQPNPNYTQTLKRKKESAQKWNPPIISSQYFRLSNLFIWGYHLLPGTRMSHAFCLSNSLSMEPTGLIQIALVDVDLLWSDIVSIYCFN